MDPDVALAQLIHALETGDLDDAEDNFENLTQWIENGGFPPKLHRATGKTIQRPSSNPGNELPQWLVDQLEEQAKAERDAGGSIEIGAGQMYVAVTLSDGAEYFFQDHEASELLDEVPDNINAEDFILASAQSW